MTTRILGERTSKRRARLIAALPLALLAALLLAISGSAFNSSLTQFEIDGDLYSGVANSGGPTNSGLDWVEGESGDGVLICPATCSATTVVDNPAVPGLATFFRDPLKVDPDPTTFTQGDKENDFANVTDPPPPGGALQSTTPWHIVSGSVPPQKDDLFDVLTYTKIVGNQAELDLAMLRTNNNGSSHLDFELNRVPSVACASDATTLCPIRTEGDLLVSFEISPGAITQRFFVWDLPGGTNGGGKGFGSVNGSGGSIECSGPLSGQEKPCPWEEISPPSSTGSVPTVISSQNTSEVAAGPWGSRLPNGNPITTIPAGGWFEASLDLDGLGFAPGCPGFGQASAKSRSSDSIPSALMDLAGPFEIDLNTCAEIKVDKVTVPTGSNQPFAFNPSWSELNFDLTDAGGLVSSGPLTPGTYDVKEVIPSGWDLTGLVCTGAATPTTFTGATVNTTTDFESGDDKANITLGNNETVTCTFTNTGQGKIKIVKDADPNHPQDFSFTRDFETGGSAATTTFALDDDGEVAVSPNTYTSGLLTAGSTYNVTEDGETNWDLTNIDCVDDAGGTLDSVVKRTGATLGTPTDAGFQAGDNKVEITLAAGETVECTYTNVGKGQIKIVKDADPNDAQDFSFVRDFDTPGSFLLDDDGEVAVSPSTYTSGSLKAGVTYNVTEDGATNWDLTNIDCVDHAGGSLDSVVKRTGATLGTPTDAGFQAGDNKVEITLAVGEVVRCTYTNTKDAKVTIVKVALPESGDDFTFAGDFGGFALEDDGVEDPSPSSETFPVQGADLAAATGGSLSKAITETVPTNWDLTAISCTTQGAATYTGAAGGTGLFQAGDVTANITVDPGDDITCTFTNKSKHVVIVLVCHQATGTLHQSTVQIDPTTGTEKQSLAAAGVPAGVTQAQLCGLGGARYPDLGHVTDKPFDVTIPSATGH